MPFASWLKKTLLGQTLPTSAHTEERLSNAEALAVLSFDALSGVILLSLCAAILVVIFKGQVNAVIPLYAVGVFTSFTLSQAGMVRRWFIEKTSGWRASAFMNTSGAIATAVVLAVVVSTKFQGGACLACGSSYSPPCQLV